MEAEALTGRTKCNKKKKLAQTHRLELDIPDPLGPVHLVVPVPPEGVDVLVQVQRSEPLPYRFWRLALTDGLQGWKTVAGVQDLLPVIFVRYVHLHQVVVLQDVASLSVQNKECLRKVCTIQE